MGASRRGPARWLALAAAAVLLGGCGLFDNTPPPPCPRISILRDAERVTLFRAGPGRDVNDIEFEAEIGEIRAGCEIKGGQVAVRTQVAIFAARGPAAAGKPLALAFFVAITDPGGRIIAKEVFESPFEFKTNQQRAGVTEEIDQAIPLAGKVQAEDYDILVGFQLSAEQLEYNRRRRAR